MFFWEIAQITCAAVRQAKQQCNTYHNNVLELRKNNFCCNQGYTRAKYVDPGMATMAITAVMITSGMSSAIAKRIYSFNEAMGLTVNH